MAKGNRPDSGWGKGDNTGDEGSRVRAFYDKTEKFANMSMHEFENAIRDKSVEYVGLFDANGNLWLQERATTKKPSLYQQDTQISKKP